MSSKRIKFPVASIAICGALLTISTEALAQAVPNLPIAVFCYSQQEKEWRVGYLYKVAGNGDAMYLSANGKLGATINAKGMVEAPTNRPAGLDCYGKTLDDLRSKTILYTFNKKTSKNDHSATTTRQHSTF